MTWHNTLATVDHFHATVALETTLAFMRLGYYVLGLVFGREWILEPVAMVQPYLHAGAMSIVVLLLMYLGIRYGIPRRHLLGDGHPPRRGDRVTVDREPPFDFDVRTSQPD